MTSKLTGEVKEAAGPVQPPKVVNAKTVPKKNRSKSHKKYKKPNYDQEDPLTVVSE